ncbi:MAG: ECF transporter S component [Oscillospiraceae bacterium]|nr:ECF transporter S component [Oscillospiraceae bacterium]
MKGFWRTEGLFTTRRLAVMGMLAALTVVFGLFDIMVGPTSRVFSVRYLPGAVGAVLFGPVGGVMVAFVGDFAATLARGDGYLPGYALSAMAQSFLYALFLFRRPLTLPRALLAQAAVFVVVVMGLGSLWQILYYGQAAGEALALERIARNLALYPVHAWLVYSLGRETIRIDRKRAEGRDGGGVEIKN